MRKEQKLSPEKHKMLTSKGCLNSDQRDSQVESSQGSFIEKMLGGKGKKNIALHTSPYLNGEKGINKMKLSGNCWV